MGPMLAPWTLLSGWCNKNWNASLLHKMIGICPNHIWNPSVCLHMSKYLSNSSVFSSLSVHYKNSLMLPLKLLLILNRYVAIFQNSWLDLAKYFDTSKVNVLGKDVYITMVGMEQKYHTPCELNELSCTTAWGADRICSNKNKIPITIYWAFNKMEWLLAAS